jgi:hypothetical protein
MKKHNFMKSLAQSYSDKLLDTCPMPAHAPATNRAMAKTVPSEIVGWFLMSVKTSRKTTVNITRVASV